MKRRNMKKLLTLSTLLLVMLSVIFGCNETVDTPLTGLENIASVEIQGGEEIYLIQSYTTQLTTNIPDELKSQLTWSTDSTVITLTSYGFVTAKTEGMATVTVTIGEFSDTVKIIVLPEGTVIPTPDTEAETKADTSVTDTEDPTEGDGTQPPEPTPDTELPTAGQDTDPVEPPVVTEPETDPAETETETQPNETETALPAVDEQARDEFYGDADPADSYEEALERSARGELSGATTVPDQAPILSIYMPMIDGLYVRNNEPYYADENTYVVVNAYGQEVFRVYRGGGYITLEEVAAYVYAFGEVPANYSDSKKTKPTQSIWGEYLRVNNTAFSGNTSKYPYEPVLPRISGCGGDLYYYEIDIGTTGTDCDPSYPAVLYNNGTKITRGAARIVYTRYDANRNSIIDPNEKFLFYTYNHYNDFQEYLNYYGGWGEMFGNITGGGTISSKYDYNPTDYVPVVMASLKTTRSLCAEETTATVLWYDFRRMSECLAWDKSRFAA